MLKRVLMPLSLGVIIAAGVVEAVVPPSRTAARSEPAAAVARPAAANSLTAKAVAAAYAFQASLSRSQRATAQYPFGSQEREKGWSNLPTAFVARPGVSIADLDATQRSKLKALLKTILSTQGYDDEEGTRKADAYLHNVVKSRPGAPASIPYGQGLFYVAFYGKPSTSRKW